MVNPRLDVKLLHYKLQICWRSFEILWIHHYRLKCICDVSHKIRRTQRSKKTWASRPRMSCVACSYRWHIAQWLSAAYLRVRIGECVRRASSVHARKWAVRPVRVCAVRVPSAEPRTGQRRTHERTSLQFSRGFRWNKTWVTWRHFTKHRKFTKSAGSVSVNSNT